MIWCLLFTKQFIEVWFGFCCEWEVNVVVVDSCQFRIKWRVELTWLARKSSSSAPALYPRMPRSTNQISISFSGRWAASQDMIGQLCSFFLNWPITRVLIHSSPSSQNLYLIVTCCLYQLTGRCQENIHPWSGLQLNWTNGPCMWCAATNLVCGWHHHE